LHTSIDEKLIKLMRGQLISHNKTVYIFSSSEHTLKSKLKLDEYSTKDAI
jgi:hypothetical protein